MKPSDSAWKAYQATLDTVREGMLAREEARSHPRVREQALYALHALTVGAHQMYMLPRPDYPEFYTLWHPYLLNWGGPSADMRYQWSFIDGRRSYRIRGRLGSTCFTDLQVFTGYFGDDHMRSLGNYDLADFEHASDGEFEIIASPEKQGGNWIKLDAGEPRLILHARDVFNDWEARPASLTIETLDRPADTMTLREDEIAVRLGKTARMVEQTIARALGFAKRIRKLAGGVNGFAEVKAEGGENKDHGASPRAGYYGMVWELAPDEALIIEAPAPGARHWSVQLMDLWWGTMDYAYHQTGLNGAQMRIDDDGYFRAVISFEDPGIANWLDPMATPVGQAMVRWYDGIAPQLPKVTKVPFSELHAHLPPATTTVSPAERRERMARRTRAALSRMNHGENR